MNFEKARQTLADCSTRVRAPAQTLTPEYVGNITDSPRDDLSRVPGRHRIREGESSLVSS